ncbi:MAG: dihydrolipoyl dehydrogenase [Candidatus Methanomethyliaceae archaeon]|nr:dihydrolipoyl dehydrogenase [Candidatus Methanomethyliaceae archaeon]MDW7970317.1 dihydrolipoyl dehydrogenase [Nitrososphaerota archaeon]
MKEYDWIVVGSGSAMIVVEAIVQIDSKAKIAVIDKDDPGGICLTRGCIPSKMLLYPAELLALIGKANDFGIEVTINKIDFSKIMERMREHVQSEVEKIRYALTHSENIDYYPMKAEFIAPYTMSVGGEIIKAKKIILCTGSKPLLPSIEGLDKVPYYTSDTILKIRKLPKSLAIIGGGYIAAEYGFFFSTMGTNVTIIGRNPQFLPEEEPEISALAKRELQKSMKILTNHEVKSVEEVDSEMKKLIAINRENGRKVEVMAEEILVASGRASNTDILKPERGNIKVDNQGWIEVNEYLETSQSNVWALGDANGKYMFKHKANYEALVVYYNAVLNRRVKVDYHAIPHAVFIYPEIASVGLREREAIEKYGEDNILIGMERFENTAKGRVMNLKDYFVKIIVEKNTLKILGAHIIGPYASILIQEIVNLMYTPDQSAEPIINGMHIHPSLSEVVERAFLSLMPLEIYHHVLEHHYQLK